MFVTQRRSSRDQRLRETEVEHLDEIAARRIVEDDDVAGLEIAVDDALRVRGLERVAQLQSRSSPMRRSGSGCMRLELARERVAAQQLHHEVQDAVSVWPKS